MATQGERIAVLETQIKGIGHEVHDIKRDIEALQRRPAGGSNSASRRERIQAQATPERGLLVLLLIDALSQRV